MAIAITVEELQNKIYNYLKGACVGFLNDVNKDIFIKEHTQQSKIPTSYVCFSIDELMPRCRGVEIIDPNKETNNYTLQVPSDFKTVIDVVGANTYSVWNLANRILMFSYAYNEADFGFTFNGVTLNDITKLENNVNKISVRIVLPSNTNIKHIFDIHKVKEIQTNYFVYHTNSDNTITEFSTLVIDPTNTDKDKADGNNTENKNIKEKKI